MFNSTGYQVARFVYGLVLLLLFLGATAPPSRLHDSGEREQRPAVLLPMCEPSIIVVRRN